MTARRTGLGRGLDALIPSALEQAPGFEVDIDLIVPNPEQPRTLFEPGALAELADSIREHGIIQPLVVSRSPQGAATYQLIAGERRLLAARQAGLTRVPVVVKEASSRGLLELALVENLQRQDLGPLEEAAAFRRLGDEFGLTQEAIAQRVGRSRPAITNSLRLLTLPAEIQSSLARGEITAGHARALLGIDDASEQLRTWRRIIEGGLTVRDAEGLASRKTRTRPAAARRVSSDVASLQDSLQSSLGTRVELRRGRKGGRLIIHFYSDEELEAIIARLG